MHQRLLNWLAFAGRRLGLGREWYVMAVAAGIGLIMSGVAMAFMLPLKWMEHAPERIAETNPTAFLVIILTLPMVGALLAGIVRATISTGAVGHGVSAVMYAIHRQQGRVSLRLSINKWLASTFTIGSGGSAGPEGPIVTIGAGIGSSIGRAIGAPPQMVGTFLGCAAAAGMASVFNAPIAGIFFVLEVLLRDFSLRTFTPIVIASVVSSVTTQSVLGGTPIFGVGPDFFREIGPAVTIAHAPMALVLGVVCGFVAVLFIRSLRTSEQLFSRMPVPQIARPVVGGAMLGILGLAFVILSGATNQHPPFFGNGYLVIQNLLSPGHYAESLGSNSATLAFAGLLLAVAALKIVATCFTLGSGGAGGLFAPSLVLGAALGAAVGLALSATGLLPGVDPAHGALVGMAGMVAATSHAPLTAILIVYEITQSYEMILPVMLGSVIATMVARVLYPESVYTMKLADLGVRVGGTSDLPLLRRIMARDVPLLRPIVVGPDDSGTRLVSLTESTGVGDFVVTDGDGGYLGMVTGVDMRRILVYPEALPLIQVNEIMRTDLPTVAPDETLDVVLDKFNASDVHCLVVGSKQADGRTKVVGIIARSRVLRAYQESLESE